MKDKILLISVHPVLEYDERLLFDDLGYDCFSLGFFSNFDQSESNSLREAFLDTDFLAECRKLFMESGCKIDYTAPENYILTDDFVNYFDIIIVHHNYHFITRNWPIIRNKVVIWRTIGQELYYPEHHLRNCRDDGLRIVRWSPAERDINGYLGEDAIIRASKRIDNLRTWKYGGNNVVTFNNNFTDRADVLFKSFYQECLDGFTADLYGLGNEDIPNYGGLLTYQQQKDVLATAGAAFITGTYPAPYTLGFIEAWMSGIPVIHIGMEIILQKYEIITFEIPNLITSGVDGFVVNSITEAKDAISSVLDSEEIAQKISANGIKAAEHFFGWDRGLNEWKKYLDNI
jgi:hypothetical protein